MGWDEMGWDGEVTADVCTVLYCGSVFWVSEL